MLFNIILACVIGFAICFSIGVLIGNKIENHRKQSPTLIWNTKQRKYIKPERVKKVRSSFNNDRYKIGFRETNPHK